MFSGGGTWQLHSGDDILDNIDVQAIHGMQKLYPLLDSLATKTSVVMMLPEPFKEYMFNSKSGMTRIALFICYLGLFYLCNFY